MTIHRIATIGFACCLLLSISVAGLSCTSGQTGDSLRTVQQVQPVEYFSPQTDNPAGPSADNAGIDPELWSALLSALQESIRTSNRQVRSAPDGINNMVADLTITSTTADSADLNWHYRSIGDYDQNSQVNISDLTVIGLHIGKSQQSEDWHRARLADGDGNGLITIADVTPIGANFGNAVSHYSVRRAHSNNPAEFSEVGSINQQQGTALPGSLALSYNLTINGLEDGDTLHVVPVDVADGSSGSVSNDVIFTSALRPLDLTASQGTLPGEVMLLWSAVEGATGYVIQRRQLSMTIYDEIGTSDAGTLTFSDTDVEAGQHRFYRVAALIDGGTSAWSDSAEGWSMELPAVPAGLTASQGTVEQAIQLDWAAVANVDGYRLYRDESATHFSETSDISLLDTAVSLPGLHVYEVTAVNAAGESPRSSQATGSAGIIPAAPQAFSASNGTIADHVSLEWQAVEYAEGYNIYRDSETSLLATVGELETYADASLTDYAEHQYWIAAYTALGAGPLSGPQLGSLKLVEPGAPQNLTASRGTYRDSIQLDWEAVASASQYRIYRDGSGTPLATVGQVDSYADDSIPDLDEHSYTVQAVNAAGQSPLSNSAAGYPDSRSNWWRFGMNNLHISRASATGPATNSLAWSYPTGSWIRCNPVMAADGTVYFGNYNGQLVALNPDGTEKRTYTAGADIFTAPAIAPDGTVYVGSHDFKLHAVNPDGSSKWTYTTGGIIRSSPAIDSQGRVIFGSQDFKLYCVDAAGNLAWSFTCGEEVRSSPAIAGDGTIYVGSGKDNMLNAIHPDGTLKWKYNTGGWVRSSPAIAADGSIYVGSSNGQLHAVSPAGAILWDFTAGDYIENCSPAVGLNGRVYIGSGDDKLYCIDPLTGTEIWSYVTGADIDSSPAIDGNGVIYVGSDDFKMHAVNPDGTLKWSYTTAALVDSGPLVAEDGRIYFGSSDGSLYCVGPVL